MKTSEVELKLHEVIEKIDNHLRAAIEVVKNDINNLAKCGFTKKRLREDYLAKAIVSEVTQYIDDLEVQECHHVWTKVLSMNEGWSCKLCCQPKDV